MKIPKARKLKSGEYVIRLRLGGETTYIRDRNAALCRRKAALVKSHEEHEERTEAKQTPETLTLRQAIDRYISERDNVLSPATIRGYRIIQRNRFKSVMDKPVDDVQNWQTVVNAESKMVSAKTVCNAWGLVASALGNIGISVKCTTPTVPVSQRPWLEPEEIGPFLSAVRGQSCEMGALLALHGLRRSELLALNKSDVYGGIIYVRGAVVPNEKNKMVAKKTTKSKQSTRPVPILIDRLSELIDEAPNGRLVTIHPDTLRVYVNRACAGAGLPEVGIHGLRHTFASLCHAQGLSEADTMRLGGWSNPATMRRIYIHLSSREKREAERRLSAFFQNASV